MEKKDTTRFGIAVDIGTTTVGMALLRWERKDGAGFDGEVLAENDRADDEPFVENVGTGDQRGAECRVIAAITFTNPQREAALGSDVISRAKNAASDAKMAERMQRLIRDGIGDGIGQLLAMADMEVGDAADISAADGSAAEESSIPIVVTGNATMLHIFSGLPTDGLLAAPFTPADISLRHETIDFGVRQSSAEGKYNTTIFPCVSAFIGGDIVAGIYALDMYKNAAPTLLVDLGTNGEMVLSANGRLYATSVAAGPAFEGANISIGMAAVDGAISHVTIKRGFCRVETITAELAALPVDQPEKISDRQIGSTASDRKDIPSAPRGICGSGLFDAVAQLYLDGIIDAHGTLSERYIDDGFPLYARDATHRLLLTQDDIRAFQTAKAAIAAGALALLRAAGVSAEEVAEVFIAGSFGEYLDLQSAAAVGLLPGTLMEKAKAVGNTSLLGAKKLLLHPEDEQQLHHIVSKCEVINLADDAFFKDHFIENMDIFP